MPVLLAATSAVSKLMLVQGYVGHWLVLPQQQPFALRGSLPEESRFIVQSRAYHGRGWTQLASRDRGETRRTGREKGYHDTQYDDRDGHDTLEMGDRDGLKRRQNERGSRRGIEPYGQRKGVRRFSDKAKNTSTRDEVWGYEDDNDIMALDGSSSNDIILERRLTAEGVTDDRDRVYRDNFFSVKGLTDIGANDVAVSALKTLGVERPSKIQAIAFSAVLTGEHCVVADQTGSGKTLAYLAPLVQRLRLEEQAKVHGRAKPGKPRVLVLAPTAELAQQVHGVVQMLSGTVPFRSCCFTGGIGRRLKTQLSLLQEGVDLLVATPGRVSTLIEAEALSLEDCRAVVLDEVDVLFMDETFKLAPIGTSAPEDTQFIFVTATLPQSVSDMLKAEFPGTKFLLGPGLHRIAPGVEEVLIDCSGPPGQPRNQETGMKIKRNALLSQLERRNALRTLVFCNTIQGCRQVENILSRANRKGQFETLVYHSAIDPKKAADNMRQFMRSNAMTPMVMVCTDRSSRGMDFDRAEVEHVLLYDFPRDPIEYMRRVGRTARAGRKGVVTVLAWGRQVPLVREIMAGNKRGKRLLTLEE